MINPKWSMNTTTQSYYYVYMFPSLFPFGIGISKMTNRWMNIITNMHIKHLVNLDDTQYKFSKHYLFPILVFSVIQWRQICLKVKLTVFRLSNMNEIVFLNKIKSIDFNEIIKKSWNINVNNILRHIKNIKNMSGLLE